MKDKDFEEELMELFSVFDKDQKTASSPSELHHIMANKSKEAHRHGY
jgi:Ca2+-binding EF-hand superfamily protein